MSLSKAATLVGRKFGYALIKDKGGEANGLFGPLSFESHLGAIHFRDGKPLKKYSLGSGAVTQGFVTGLLKDQLGTTNNKATPLLATLNRMLSGTGTNAAAATDYSLQTAVNVYSGAITPSLATVASSNNASIQWIGTIAYTGTSAITEWGLFAGNPTPGSQYNTSTVTITSTTITPGTNPSWTVNTWAGYLAIIGGTGTTNATGAGISGGFIESNSGTALTISQGASDIAYWVVNTNAGAAGTPANNTRVDIWPFMADRKTFSAINVVNGDSIQFTYTLTASSGG